MPGAIHDCCELRDNARLPHESYIKVKTTDGSSFHKGRLVNFSRKGLYFESDTLFAPGAEIFIAIADSPFDGVESSGHDFHHGIIRHREEGDSHFSYGYGVELVSRLGTAFFRSAT